MEFIIDSVEQTMNLGFQLGKLVKPSDIICLNGDLGAGKTHFTKGLAKGLGVSDYITSPTFTIVNEYEGRLKLYHFDVYRVNDPDEIYAIGFDEYIFSDGVTVIEWASYIDELIPKAHLSIDIRKLTDLGDNFRKIILNSHDERYNYIKEINLC